MKKIMTTIALVLGLCSAAWAQQYQMEVKTRSGSISSYLLESILNVSYQDGKTFVNLRGKTAKVYDNMDIVSISWINYNGSSTGGKNSFALDAYHTEVVTPDYSINFSPGCITSSATLTVTKPTTVTDPLDCGTDEMVVYDFNLGNVHELDGIAEIRVPMRRYAGDMLFAGYYNPTSKEWEPVNNHYDETTGEMVIDTDHLSMFGFFKVKKEKGIVARLQLIDKDDLATAIMAPTLTYLEIANRLKQFVYSNDPDAEALEAFSGQYSEMSQLGLDIGYNAIQSLGFESTFLDGFSKVLGHLGTALSVYQICRNDFRGEDIQKAGNTMKLCLQQVTSHLSSLCSSNIMLASMASVAILDYAINKFATTAWAGRRDMYLKGYDYYMEKHGIEYWEWRWKLWPYFTDRQKRSNEELNRVIDDMVVDYCNMPWRDWDEYTGCVAEATGMSFTYSGGWKESFKEEFSGKMRGELYNYDIPEAMSFIKKQFAQEAFDKMNTEMRKYTYELNKPVELQFFDSSFDEEKDTKSQYAGYTVRFKNLPQTIDNPSSWECTLNNKGEGKIRTRVGLMAIYELKPVVELVSTDKKVVRTIELSNLKAGYTSETYINRIDLVPKDQSEILAIFVNGKLYCSSPTYDDGEEFTMSPFGMSYAMFPNAVKFTRNGKQMHVQCFTLSTDENDEVVVLPETMAAFDIDDVDAIDTNKAKIKNLYVNTSFSYSSGDDIQFMELYQFTVGSDISMTNESINDLGYGMFAEALGATKGKVWTITGANGLSLSQYSLIRKEWIYVWDRDAHKDVLDHIEEHNFTLHNNPSNMVRVVILFK